MLNCLDGVSKSCLIDSTLWIEGENFESAEGGGSSGFFQRSETTIARLEDDYDDERRPKKY